MTFAFIATHVLWLVNAELGSICVASLNATGVKMTGTKRTGHSLAFQAWRVERGRQDRRIIAMATMAEAVVTTSVMGMVYLMGMLVVLKTMMTEMERHRRETRRTTL
jgi:hypothetical protein